jgi:hypothetical protein
MTLDFLLRRHHLYFCHKPHRYFFYERNVHPYWIQFNRSHRVSGGISMGHSQWTIRRRLYAIRAYAF